MDGNFKFIKIMLLLCSLIGCNNKNNKELGKIIINDNINLFISNLYGLPSKNTSIFIMKNVGSSDFITEYCDSIVEMGGLNLIDNCKQNLFETINKEGFYINKDTKYTSIDLEQLSSNKIKLLDINENITEKEYVKIIFSNLYIDEKKGKAFIMVQESDVSKENIDRKVDIYYFESKNSKWLYVKKQMLLTT